jgi:hypothetical protein
MAFNPFHSFRRYSKVVFAGLAILCMFTFVLSSGMGKGDFFQSVTDMFGGGSGSTVVTVHGNKIDAREFDAIQNQRRLANEYMAAAVGASHAGLERRVIEIFGRLDATDRQALQPLLSARYSTLSRGTFQQIPQIQQYIQSQIALYESQKKTDLVNALGILSKLLDLDLTVLNLRFGQPFFGPTESIDNTVNFLIWRHEADRLGVRLGNEEISEMIKDETRGEFNKEAAEMVEQSLRQRLKGGFSAESLFVAIGDELRAQIAELALTGASDGVGRRTLTRVPDPPTPQESWELFKDARTTIKAGLIDVPVKDYLPKITATPSEDELKKLFELHKMEEPAPDRDQPGFKEPRKTQIAWVGAGPDLAYYQTAADRVLAIAPALRLLGNTSPVLALSAPLQLDAEMLTQEDEYRSREPKWTEPISSFAPKLHDSSIVRVETAATLIATGFGSFGSGAPAAMSAPMAAQAVAAKREAVDRAKFGATMIGLAASPDPFGLAAAFGQLPTISLSQVRPQLMAKAREALVNGARGDSGLVAADLVAFRGEVMKLGREKGKAEVDKYVADFVKQRGLQFGLTAEPRDAYHLGDDPSLAPLKDAYRKVYGGRDLLLRQFGPYFFEDQARQSGAPDGVFIPHKYITTGMGDEKQHYYWWRTEDILPKTPKYEKAKPEVVEAWKRLQARDLAKKEAERLQDLVKKAQGDPQKLRDIAAQAGNLEYFDLGPIAQYMPQINPTAMGEISRDYATLRPGITPEQVAQIYHIPADRIAYPDGDMVKTLLDLREKQKGATAIVTDKPKQNYYVSSLLDTQEPSQDDFRAAYKGSMTRAGADRDPLLNFLGRGKTDEYRKAVLEQLRAEAKVVINDTGRRRGSDRSE